MTKPKKRDQLSDPTAKAVRPRSCESRNEHRISSTRDLHALAALVVRVLDEPVSFGERAFSEGATLRIHGLTPLHEGVSLRDHVDRLTVFPDPATLSVRIRRASLLLPPANAALLHDELRPLLQPYVKTVNGYRWPR
ncbi:hypothetical protein ACFWWB_30810 [Streptomyces sp. NPDC058690]|uniref:hypothetical protein n=1 Tax=unclassified Streptomyces TaxID=2593676 RepID=UPI00365CAD05